MLDEAFKSRIHYKIYYPNLTLEQTLDIWKLNIHRVRKIEDELAKVENRDSLLINEDELIAFAKQRFQEAGSNRHGDGRWNGRQIRNAFQVACSLAYYEHGIREDERRARQQSAVNSTANVTGLVGARYGLLGPPTLSVHHFEMMHKITASFENYRTAVHGGTTDTDLALEAEYRHDGYQDSLTKGMQAEYRDNHLRAAAAAAAGGNEFADEIDYSTIRPMLRLTLRRFPLPCTAGCSGSGSSTSPWETTFRLPKIPSPTTGIAGLTMARAVAAAATCPMLHRL